MSRRILVAADAPMVVAILSHKLRREGHQVITARGAADLWHRLESDSFDCALFEAAFLDEPEGTHAPPSCAWLAIVDGRDHDAALQAMRAGAAGIVGMPFKPTAVAAQVAALLAMVQVRG